MAAVSAQQYVPLTSVISEVVGVAVKLQAIHKQNFVRAAELERSAEKAAEREQQRASIEDGSITLELSDEARQAVQGVAPVRAASETAVANPEIGRNLDLII